jgi:hypothetical protein
MTKDERFFLDNPPEIVSDLALDKLWTPELSSATKEAIWQYLQTLYMLGMTIKSVPKETLDMIEDVAKKCADGMANGGGGLDEKALMSNMAGLLGGLMKNKN